jgi:hypothetical protein
LSLILGRVIVGHLVDRLWAPGVAAAALGLPALGCLLLGISGANDTGWLVLGVMLVGIGAGAEFDLAAFLVSRYFGMRDYGRLFGIHLTDHTGFHTGPGSSDNSSEAPARTRRRCGSAGPCFFGGLALLSLGRYRSSRARPPPTKPFKAEPYVQQLHRHRRCRPSRLSGCSIAAAGGFEGAITLIGDEPGVPYQRPPLSKAYLLGKVGTAALRFRPPEFFDEHRITRIEGSATAIDQERRELVLASGERLAYGHLVLATGAVTVCRRSLASSSAAYSACATWQMPTDCHSAWAARSAQWSSARASSDWSSPPLQPRGIAVDVLELGTRPMARAPL